MKLNSVTSMNAQRNLNMVNNAKGKSAEKLSSGFRINRAADDAAGLSISEEMRKQIRGLTRSSINAQDGISMVQIADGAMSEVNDMLNRCVELAVKAANGTLSVSDRSAIQDEINQIRSEIDQISERTHFNEIRVLEPGDPGTDVYVEGDGIEYHGDIPAFISTNELADGFMSNTYTTTESYTYEDTSVTPSVIQTQQVSVDHAAAYLDFSQYDPTQANSVIGKGMYFTCCTCDNHYSIEFVDSPDSEMVESGRHYVFKVGIQGATSGSDLIDRILEVTKDYAGELGNPKDHYTKMVKDGDTLVVYDDRSSDGTIFNNLPADATWQGWENPGTAQASRYAGLFGPGIGKADMVYDHTEYGRTRAQVALQVASETGDFMVLDMPSISSRAIGVDKVSVMDEDKATDAIKMFMDAGAYVSAERSRMGAYQNRLEHTIANLDNTIENTTSAESKIRDTDMAEEMVAFSKSNILQQAGQSVLAQANTSKQGILSLLQ